MSKSKRKNIRDEDFLKSFGVHLRNVRESKGLTQQDIADQIDIEVMQVSRVERGLVNTSICIIKEIAVSLDVSLSELFALYEKN